MHLFRKHISLTRCSFAMMLLQMYTKRLPWQDEEGYIPTHEELEDAVGMEDERPELPKVASSSMSLVPAVFVCLRLTKNCSPLLAC